MISCLYLLFLYVSADDEEFVNTVVKCAFALLTIHGIRPDNSRRSVLAGVMPLLQR